MKILVALDFSEASAVVVNQAMKFARLLPAQVWLVHVLPSDPAFVGYEPGPNCERDQIAKDYWECHERLRREAEAFQKEGIESVPLLIQGSEAESLLKEAVKLDVDLIMLGSHGHGAIYQLVAGSVCQRLLRQSHCPVLVVPVRGK